MLSIIFDEFKIVEEVDENLGVCVMNIFPKVSSLPISLYKPHENGDIDFLKSHVTSCWSLDQRVMFGSL